MAYMIQVFDFDAAVPIGGGVPFGGAQGISFAPAQQSRIYLDDADNMFQPATFYTEQDQKLLIDTEMGGAIIGAGTILTYRVGQVATITQTGTDYSYYVFFPHKASGSNSSATAIGDKSAVLVVPTQTTTPPLDPTKTFDYARVYTGSTGFAVADTPIPPSYLNPTCFATGTLIDTARGPRPVETLVAGDMVLTRDRGLRPLAWTGGRHLTARHLDIAPNLRPIRIRKDALGPGMPARDLTVSPQHRVLVRSPIAARICGAPEVLVAARHLCTLPGIEVVNPPGGVGYHHLLFDRHEIVRSNGAWTESLFTGPQALKSLGPAALREIRAIFPELFGPGAPGWTGARDFLTAEQTRDLARRHLKNIKPLVA
ncbi:Hint domain-containing protein [Paracoccus sp. S1E-3]|uniref:Hint domain-containing protein n=1 Tax=Paracoccus sp. S1E-3 TaxID=2756130 RepID=UPI0015EE7930|nr:Hint domain-containing protein [Paracoccus sp. S1E-3]MBA4489571.1 Hint domain-containing protein [Paracoccus sp. S1E-3]